MVSSGLTPHHLTGEEGNRPRTRKSQIIVEEEDLEEEANGEMEEVALGEDAFTGHEQIKDNKPDPNGKKLEPSPEFLDSEDPPRSSSL